MIMSLKNAIKGTPFYKLLKLPYDFLRYIFSYKTNRHHIRRIESQLNELAIKSEKRYDDILNTLFRLHPITVAHNIVIETDVPVAIDSIDHQVPSGTIRDNTLYPRFVHACERYWGGKGKYLDLGCAGGGVVRNFLEAGHFAAGIEGSNLSLVNRRAEWGRIPNHLFTADITAPFMLRDKDSNQPFLFNMIGAWEVMEHMAEEKHEILFKNIVSHLEPNGIFVASVATFHLLHHVCVHDYEWWVQRFAQFGLTVIDHTNIFSGYDFPRGLQDWSSSGQGFHVICKKLGSI